MATTVPLNSRVRITDSLHPRRGLEGTVEGVSNSSFSLNPYQVSVMGEEYWLAPDQFQVIASADPGISFSLQQPASALAARPPAAFSLSHEEEGEEMEIDFEVLSNIYEDMSAANNNIENINDSIGEVKEEIDRLTAKLEDLQTELDNARERQEEGLNRLWNFLDEHGHAP